MYDLFNFVYLILVAISRTTGLSYNEINIIVYYYLIPLIYFSMIDKILKTHLFKIGLTFFSILIMIFTNFSDFSDWLFDISVQFLLYFSIIGWNYIVASVIICVFVPILIFIPLFYFSYYPSVKQFIQNLR